MGKEKELGYFSEEVRSEVAKAQNYICKVCTCRIDDFHHKLPNTSSNRKLFPLFLSSIFNCVGLCRGCHDSEAIQAFSITMSEAAAYESYLMDLRDGGW